MKPVLYLDLDGVLVDFVSGALAAHGAAIPPDQVRWDFHEQIGVSGNQFWKPFGFDFWANLGWTSEGPLLLNLLEKIFGEEIVLMTSPCETEGCLDGKKEWVKQHLPAYRKRFCPVSEKFRLAAPCKILIDDNHDNVDKFVMKKGKAVLVPRPWNRLLGETNDKGQFDVYRVIEEVKKLEQKIGGYVSYSFAGPMKPLEYTRDDR